MKTLKSFGFIRAFLLGMILGVPSLLLPQDSRAEAAKRFSQEELDQIMAPIALYPDSLLAHVLMASTYPLEVVLADRWVQQNKNLSGNDLLEAADKEPWDPSVKALVPFPDLLSMMAEKLEWTEKLGNAFLAQQSDVMETVQNLRKKAYEAGNLKSTDEQRVIVEKETILVEPTDSRVVYVPVYDPWWVYGSWGWPLYPPYVFYPYPYASAFYYRGHVGFSVGFFVGAYWRNWGYCNWSSRTVYVNHHYYRPPYPGYRSAPVGKVVASGGAPTMQQWRHDPYHRRRVEYKDAAVGARFGQASRTAADNRRISGTFEESMARRKTAATRTGTPAATGTAGNGRGTSTGLTEASIHRGGRPEATVSRTRPDRVGADRSVYGRSGGKSSPGMERGDRMNTSSVPRKEIEQGGFERQAGRNSSHSPSAQGGAAVAPADVNRGASSPKHGPWGRGESVSAPKAQDLNRVRTGQTSVDSALSQGRTAGGGRTGGWGGGGGGAHSRGGTGGQAGSGMRGRSLAAGR